MQAAAPPPKRQSLQITVPDPNHIGCDKAALLIEIPQSWTLTSTKHKETPVVGESYLDLATGPEHQAHIVLVARSLGDELEHTPAELCRAHEQALRRRYWVRSFAGKHSKEGGKFVRELTAFPLYRTLAKLSPPPPSRFAKCLAWIRREPPGQVWITECFKFFRFQTIIISIGPASDRQGPRTALELLSRQLKQALARYAAGRVL